MNILIAIFVGIAFGFVLERVGAADPQRILGMLRLTDTHLIKVILGAIAFSSALLFTGLALGFVDPGHISIKDSHWGVLLGGGLLGLGFAVAGYCPGTGLCALGAGRRDAIWFVVGGLAGALMFTLFYEYIQDSMLYTAIAGGKVTLATTGSQYDALAEFAGLAIALPIALLLGAVSWWLPSRLLK